MADHDPHGDATRADAPVTDPTMAMPAAAGAPPPAGRPPPGPPPSAPRDRAPWILAGLLAVILLVGLAIVLLGGDDDESATSSTTTTTEEATTSTTTAPTTTTTAPTTTTTTPPSTVDPATCVSSGPEEPEPTAQVVYEAYTLGDRDCAANLATADAIDQLFGIPGGGGGWTFAGCVDLEEPDPHTHCSFTFEGGSTGFLMNYSDTEGWTVYEVSQTAD